MSSLAQQLSGVAQASQTLALDRKKRSKLHSVSLIYESLHAATQDYDTIFSEAFDALEKLETLDRRFGKFKLTIFSETSIHIDRQVQSKEQNENLDKTINVFLSLLSPYWHLAVSIKAAEWLVRRFQMHVYNSEVLLLSTLPYFDQPVFERVLHVIPKMPTMFQWLTGFKKANNRLPSKNSVVKAFTDVAFFNLYSKHIIDELQHKNQHRRQLVFFVAMTISTLASMSSNLSSAFADFVPLVLEVSGSLLVSKDQESKISAYTILAVLSTAVPLSRDVVLASVDTILLYSDNATFIQALTCILRLYQSIQSGSLEPLPLSTLNRLPKDLLTKDSDLLSLIKSSSVNNKFVCSYIKAMIINDISISFSDLSALEDLGLSHGQLANILIETLNKINTDATRSSDLVPVLKFVIAQNKQVFINVLKHINVEIYALEMKIQTTLFTEEDDLIEAGLANNIIENVQDEDVIMTDAATEVDEDFEEQLSNINFSCPSFLHATKEIDETFHKLVGLYLRSMQLNKTGVFLSKCFSNADDTEISFLLRTSTSINTPFKGRTYALKLLNSKIEKLDKKYLVYPILPILCTLLINSNVQIRNNANVVIQTMNKRGASGKTLLLSDNMYGQKSSSEVAMLAPKDGINLLSIIASFSQYVKLDENQFHVNFTKVVAEKKLGKITLAFFASNAILINIPSVKIDFMEIVRKGASAIKGAALPSQLFESFLAKYVEKRQVWFNRCQETGFNFNKFESQVVSLISLKEDNENGIEFLEQALNCSEIGLVEQTSKRIIQILSSLTAEYQVRIVKNIIDNGLGDQQYSKTVYYDPVDILESVDLSNGVFVQVLEKSILNQSSNPQPNVPKRRRRSSASTRQAMKEQGVSTLATTHLKKTTVLLEVLDKATSPSSNGSRFKASYELLKLLFQILDDLETLGKDGKLAILYTQETLASCLRNVIDILKESNVMIDDSSSIRADIVVSVIRSSESPQVQNKLLLVIASLASLSPELVLHSVMPIFTFMGAHTIRQDDEFSSHVVEQTILCVVPALIKSVDMANEIEVLIASFVTAFQHIPRHRRVRLFTTLAKTLKSEYSVHLILFLCGQQYATSFAKHKMGDCSALTDFSSSFLQNFHPEEQLDAIKKFLKLWSCTPDDISDKDSTAYTQIVSRSIFTDVLLLNKSQLFNLRKCLISFIRQTIVENKGSNGVPRLRLKIASMILQGEEVATLIATFGNVIEIILDIIDNSVVNTEDEEIINEFYKLLGDVIVLLPIEEFVRSVTDILTIKDVKNISESHIRVMRHITVLTSSKFDLEHIDDPYAHEGIGKLIPILLQNIKLNIDVELSQSSLDTLSKLIERFNDRIESTVMINALSLIVTDAGLLNKESPELIVSSIGCIARIVNVIGVKMIGFFPVIVPPLLKIFQESQESLAKSSSNDDADDEDDEVEDSTVYEAAKLVQTSIIVLFSCLIKKIPAFITPNLSDILKLIVDAQIVSESVRSSILNVIVEYIDSKTLLVTLCSVWAYVSSRSASSIGLFLNTLDSTIDACDKKIIIGQASTFVRFLLNALEYRGVSTFDNNTISRVESSVSKCGISFVMKLNDKSFRPLFASIVRWAFDGEGVITSISEVERLKSFFKFYNKLQENLRSIVTSYFSYLLDSTDKLLARFTSGELDDINLRRLIFISLASSFKYDQDEYWLSTTRFTPISKALCDQFINVEDGIGKYLVKAITGLVHDCSSSDEHNRSMNEILMKHMKADCRPREKYWAVKSLETIYKKVGENWMSLLPQLVPIIAELLEDDDEDVEMEVRTGLVKVVEEVMGESLDRYLD